MTRSSPARGGALPEAPIGYRRPMLRARPVPALVLLALCVGLALTSGCASRPRRHSIIDRAGMQVDLVRYVKGFKTEPQGFEHPAIISKERLVHILGAVEIETREKGGATIRQPGIHAELVDPIAEASRRPCARPGPTRRSVSRPSARNAASGSSTPST
jgi:hypothetical protein